MTIGKENYPQPAVNTWTETHAPSLTFHDRAMLAALPLAWEGNNPGPDEAPYLFFARVASQARAIADGLEKARKVTP